VNIRTKLHSLRLILISTFWSYVFFHIQNIAVVSDRISSEYYLNPLFVARNFGESQCVYLFEVFKFEVTVGCKFLATL